MRKCPKKRFRALTFLDWQSMVNSTKVTYTMCEIMTKKILQLSVDTGLSHRRDPLSERSRLQMEKITAERRLIRKMVQMGLDEELMLETVSVLETETNCEKMIAELEQMRNPSREAMLFTALLIADPE